RSPPQPSANRVQSKRLPESSGADAWRIILPPRIARCTPPSPPAPPVWRGRADSWFHYAQSHVVHTETLRGRTEMALSGERERPPSHVSLSP
ncbi:unnamed protein product, partial [Arctogadus glacialis]